MLSRDHYAVLGITPDADEATIENAFRRLGRRYHPDLNPGDSQALAAFERIKLAYSVLSRSDERARYDRQGRPAADPLDAADKPADAFAEPAVAKSSSYQELFRALCEHAKRARPQRGGDIPAAVTIRLADAERGRRSVLEIRRMTPCLGCGGRGRVQLHQADPCRTCRGSGKEVFGRGALSVAVACADCDGEGLHAGARCTECNGSSLTNLRETVAVQIPAGVTDGQLVRIPGAGHHGPRSGPAGDLLVTCRVQSDPRFERHGPHLWTTVPVSVSEAILGARIEVRGLDGESLRLRVPPGTQGGQQIRLRGHGLEMPGGRRGDLIAAVSLWLPDVVDEDAKQLIREFGERTAKPGARGTSAGRATVRR